MPVDPAFHLIGIDASLSATGVVILACQRGEPGVRVIGNTTIRTVKRFRGEEIALEERLSAIGEQVRDACYWPERGQQDCFVGIEHPIHIGKHSAQTTVVLGLVAGVCYAATEGIGPRFLVMPTQAKKALALTGGAKKPDMRVAALAGLPADTPSLTEHEIDAIGVALAARAYMEDD